MRLVRARARGDSGSLWCYSYSRSTRVQRPGWSLAPQFYGVVMLILIPAEGHGIRGSAMALSPRWYKLPRTRGTDRYIGSRISDYVPNM